VHNSFGAMQDVAIDALAVNTLHEDERGLANGVMFAGAALGMALGGRRAVPDGLDRRARRLRLRRRLHRRGDAGGRAALREAPTPPGNAAARACRRRGGNAALLGRGLPQPSWAPAAPLPGWPSRCCRPARCRSGWRCSPTWRSSSA
jgi:hypothetical protein